MTDMKPLSRRSLLGLLAWPVACCALPHAVASSGNAARNALRAPPPEVMREIPAARLFGKGRLRRFLFHVYDARLWAKPDFDEDRFAEAPLALELEYGRTLLGPLIAERSLEEMRRGGAIPAEQERRWLAAMQRVFADVHEGDRMTGVQLPGEATRFFLNGQFVGEIRDPEFTRLFFGIWLAPHTSEPGLREALLAGARSGS